MTDNIQCDYCGKFISYTDIENGSAKYTFIPDTEVSSEYMGYTCKRCDKLAAK